MCFLSFNFYNSACLTHVFNTVLKLYDGCLSHPSNKEQRKLRKVKAYLMRLYVSTTF